MSNKDVVYLCHILDAIADIECSIGVSSKDTFLYSKDMRDANVRRLEIIGEAVKNISITLKQKHPKVEWNKIAGTRDKIIHHYFGVDLDIVWYVLSHDIPILKEQILILKRELVFERK